MTIINFTVNFDALASQSDSGDDGIDADIISLIGDVTFTPQFSDDHFVLAPDYSPRPAGFKPRQFTGYIDSDGQLKASRGGAVGVRLWANDPVFNLERLVYRVDWKLTTPLGDPVAVATGYIEAPSTDIAVNLTEMLESTGHSSVATPPTFYTLGDVASPLGEQLVTATTEAEARTVIGALSPDDVSDEVAAAVAAAETVTDAAALAVDTALEDAGVVSGGSTIIVDDITFSITDSERRRSDLELGVDGRFTERAVDSIKGRFGIPSGVDAVPYDGIIDTGVRFIVADSALHRSDLELGPDGRLTDRVLASIKSRLGLPSVPLFPEVAADGRVFLCSTDGTRTLLGTITGASNPTLLDPTTVAVDTSTVPKWVSTTQSTPSPVFPKAEVACWGDSLTYGAMAGANRASPTYPETLATALSVSVYNGGVGGESSTDIALRQGGLRPLCTLTGNQIPSGSTSPITLTAISPSTGWLPKTRAGTLAGVAGTLVNNAGSPTVFTFTPSGAPPATVSVPAGTPFIMSEGDAYRDRINIIWAGRNNISNASGDAAKAAAALDIVRDVISMANWLTPYAKRYLVVSTTYSGLGGGYRTPNAVVNERLKAAFGSRFVDLNAYLLSSGLSAAGITPTATDTTYINDGAIPPSLLADGVHFTQVGYNVIANYLAGQLTARNWI